jgi:hypothetical protein
VTTNDLAINRDLWNTVNADFTDRRASEAWAAPEITWGLFEADHAHEEPARPAH